jgi:5-oxoprolinase (ATP-hydrolysing) subunit A
MTPKQPIVKSKKSPKVLSPPGRKILGRATVDLNCDMGEDAGNDKSILPFISTVNIACGYHAGDEKTIWQTIEGALKHKVAVGAHPSYLDRENFGRTEMDLPPEEVYELVTQQLLLFNEIANSVSAPFHHVKPHGALYNRSAKDKKMAIAIARAVKDFDERLILFGLSGSHSVHEAKAIGLKTASEVFADRSYQDDGSLSPRSVANALIEDISLATKQVLQMIKKGTVISVSGKEMPILAETICIHGDGKQAVKFAKEINRALKENHIDIKAL